jgi:hypothetical protein
LIVVVEGAADVGRVMIAVITRVTADAAGSNFVRRIFFSSFSQIQSARPNEFTAFGIEIANNPERADPLRSLHGFLAAKISPPPLRINASGNAFICR